MEKEVSGDGKRKSVAGGAADSSDDSEDEDVDAMIGRRDAYVKRMIKSAGIRKKSDWPTEKTEAVGDARRAVLKALYFDMIKGKKCYNCQGQVLSHSMLQRLTNMPQSESTIPKRQIREDFPKTDQLQGPR
jgi:hypothetical protein